VSKMEEVEFAEARMNAAKDALLNHIEARESIDHDRYRRLLAGVKETKWRSPKPLHNRVTSLAAGMHQHARTSKLNAATYDCDQGKCKKARIKCKSGLALVNRTVLMEECIQASRRSCCSVEALARELLSAYEVGRRVSLSPSTPPGFDLSLAYGFEAALLRGCEAGGHRADGRKVGYANPLWYSPRM
jgi:hypothetical protein